MLDQLELDSLLDQNLQTAPDPSLALCNTLQGAVFLVRSNEKANRDVIELDREGLSPLIRTAMYCLALISQEEISNFLKTELLNKLNQFLAIVNQLISDEILLPSEPPLWKAASSGSVRDAAKVVESFQKDMANWLLPLSDTNFELYKSLVHTLFADSTGDSPTNYYNARAYSGLAATEWDEVGDGPLVVEEAHLGEIRRSTNVIQSTAYVSVKSESTAVLRVYNELMSDISGTDFDKDPNRALERLVLLNKLFRILDERRDDLPQQRIVFFVKHALPYLTQEVANAYVVCEIFRAFYHMLPLVADLYGDFWSQSISAIVKHLSKPSSETALLHAILILASKLQIFANDKANDETNEDLKESWQEHKSDLGSVLIGLLEFQSRELL